MIRFDPQDLEAKESGRMELLNETGLRHKETAPYFTAATSKNFQRRYNAFVNAFPEEAVYISRLRPDGVGPGEMVAWFVFDNVTLGGKNADTDLFIGSKPFAEMKGGYHNRSCNSLDNFKISKDGDRAVTSLSADLWAFNFKYREITGDALPGWHHSQLKMSTLRDWEGINLTKLALANPKTPNLATMLLPVDIFGRVVVDGEEITHLGDPDGIEKMQQFASTPRPVPVDSKVATLKRIVNRWRDLVFQDYLVNKKMALVNKDTMQMMFFGELSKNMVGLYCVGRNQPWARIYLP